MNAELTSELPQMDRRSLLAHLAKIGATSLIAALGGSAIPKLAAGDQPGTSAFSKPAVTTGTRRKFRYGMVIDTRRCVGCKACVVACKAENKTPPGVSYTVVLDAVLGNQPEDKPLFMTKPCFHCENPPCVDVCPVGATFKRERDGIVVVDYDRCIGCRYSITGCPYGARYFDYGDNYAAVAENTPYRGVPSPEYSQFRTRKKESHRRVTCVSVLSVCICRTQKVTMIRRRDAGRRVQRPAPATPFTSVTSTTQRVQFPGFCASAKQFG